MNNRKCALCGKIVNPLRKRDKYKTLYYKHKHINVSCGIDLVFCNYKHKLEYIHKVLKKNKSILFFLSK